MPVIATTNIKQKNMFNMIEFTIDDIKKDAKSNLEFNINNETFSLNEFRESFLPNFCNTVYKYQGGKIDENYNIWDIEKRDIKEMYTCLSRTTKLEYIHLDSKKKCKYYRERQQAEMIIVNSYFNSDYQNGKIYLTQFGASDKCYIGSTTQLLENRLFEHLSNPKRAVYPYRGLHPIIELICLCPCKDKQRLKRLKTVI